MTISRKSLIAALGAVLLSGCAISAHAQDYTITVWSGGTGQESHYRVDAIVMAADILEREAEIRGEDLNITIESQIWSGWDDFKQALTLAAESGSAPHIIVSGHEDIGPWSQAGILRPLQDYADFHAWPLNDLYENLIEISSYNGQIWGIPQDSEARPFFASRAHLSAIGYSDDEIAELPALIESGQYTLYDMLDDAKAIQDAGLVEPGMGFGPRVSNGTDYWQFYLSFGGEMIDQESGRIVFDREALTGMYQFFVDAVEMGVVPATYLGGDFDDWHRNVVADRYGFWHGGTWHKAQWERSFGLEDFFEKMVYSLIPAGNEAGSANTITHPLVYLLSTAGSEDEAVVAAELITIATEPRINTLHAVKSGHLAISHAQNDIPLFFEDRWMTEATEHLLAHATAIPNNSDFGVFWDAMFQGLEASWTGMISVEEAVNRAQSQVESGLGDAVIIR